MNADPVKLDAGQVLDLARNSAKRVAFGSGQSRLDCKAVDKLYQGTFHARSVGWAGALGGLTEST